MYIYITLGSELNSNVVQIWNTDCMFHIEYLNEEVQLKILKGCNGGGRVMAVSQGRVTAKHIVTLQEYNCTPAIRLLLQYIYFITYSHVQLYQSILPSIGPYLLLQGLRTQYAQTYEVS